MAVDFHAHQHWLDSLHHPMVVGIAGGSGSGKTSVARSLCEALGKHVLLLQHDDYYHDLTHLSVAARAQYNYDHPSALDTALLVRQVQSLRSGHTIRRPQYNFVDQSRIPDAVQLTPRPIIVIEGIMVLQDEALREQMDLRIFVDTAESDRLARRIARDEQERGASADRTRRQFAATVKPMHDQYVEPSKAFADFIIPHGYNAASVAILLSALQRIAQTLALPPSL